MKPLCWRIFVVLSTAILITACNGGNEDADVTTLPASEVVATNVATEATTNPWQQYSNHQLGITMEHPGDWFPVDIETIAGVPMTSFSAPVANSNPQVLIDGQQLLFTVWRGELGDSGTIEDWAIDQLTAPYGFGPAQREYVELSSFVGLKLSYDEGRTTVIAVDANDYRYFLMTNIQGVPPETFSSVLQQVLQSVRFSS